jgi:hypothetical protein
MFELVCLAYLLEFSNPVYTEPNSYQSAMGLIPFSADETLQSMLLVLLGVSSMIAGYYVVVHLLSSVQLPRVDLPIDSARLPRFVVAGMFFGLTTTFLQVLNLTPDRSGGLGAVVRIIAAQYSIAVIILAYRLYRGELTAPVWRYLLFGGISIGVIFGLAFGSLESTLIPVALLLIVRWHVTRRFSVQWLIAGFVAFVLLQSVKDDFRQQLALNPGMSVLSKATLWAEMPSKVVQTTLTGDVPTNLQTLVRQSVSRFDVFHAFVLVHRLTPSVVPYFGGDSYTYFLVGWIPRAVWPDKPTAQVGQVQFELDYGLLTGNQITNASIGIGQISEAYANFGAFGIFLVLLLQGAFFAILGTVLNGPESDGGRAIYLWIMVYFLNGIGTDTATIFGAVIQNAVAAAIILRLFSTGWGAPTSGDTPARPHLYSPGRRAGAKPLRLGPRV